LDELLERLEKLRIFDPQQGVELHRRFAAGIGADSSQGRAGALRAISSLKGKEDQAELVLYVASVIAQADRSLSESEWQELAAICEALGLAPEDALGRIPRRAES